MRVICRMSHLSSVSLSAEDLWALDFTFSAYLPRRLFSFFFTDAGHLTVCRRFQISATQTLIHYSFVLFAHRLRREEEICFYHMLIYSELLVEADRYLFPRGRRESDGGCCYIFISSTPPDELSHPHMENFCSDVLHKEGEKQGVWLSCSMNQDSLLFRTNLVVV